MPALSARTKLAPLFAPAQRRLFQRVLDVLGRGGVDFAVAGAFAFQRYTGIFRFTKDLDLFLSAGDLSPALACCRQAGLRARVVDPVWLAKAHRGDHYVDLITGMSNGVLRVTPAWIRLAPHDTILDRRVRVLAAEELLLSKLFVTRRERFDGSDICHIIYCCGARLDWPRVLAGTGEHWELLLWHLLLFRYVYAGAAGCVPPALWRELLARRPAGAGFRGTLIDPLMFAPDVEAWGLDDLEAASRAARLGRRAREA